MFWISHILSVVAIKFITEYLDVLARIMYALAQSLC